MWLCLLLTAQEHLAERSVGAEPLTPSMELHLPGFRGIFFQFM